MSVVLKNHVNQHYKHRFINDIESKVTEKGLSKNSIWIISENKSGSNRSPYSKSILTRHRSEWKSRLGAILTKGKQTFYPSCELVL